MQSVMVQFEHDGKAAPSVEEVCRLFGLGQTEIDREFGVVATDPSEGLYTVLVDADAAQRVESVLATRQRGPAEGVFANPRVEPFGPSAR